MQTLDISYTVVLRNATFGIEKVFDSIFGLAYSREINGVGSFNFSINGQDSRIPLFKLDNIIEIRRGLLVAGLQKYTECVGLVRKTNLSVSNQGEYNFEISGVGLNHFLERRRKKMKIVLKISKKQKNLLMIMKKRTVIKQKIKQRDIKSLAL